MRGLISAAFGRGRVVLMLLAFILAVGAIGYRAIPKESNPEIPIPIIYVVTTLDGISPEDSERLLVEPLESELASIEGLKEMSGSSAEGYGSVTLEFDPGFDAEEALDKVREAVDRAVPDLPEDASEPSVNEVNTATFPIFTAILSGPVPERTLIRIAEELQEDIEALEGVLEVDVAGARDELLEVLIDPTVFETYDLTFDELISQISRNNRLIAAGAIDTGAGRLVLKVPGLIEDVEDVLNMPVKVRGTTVVTFADIATVRRTYRDPDSFARIDGQPALALDVKKRVGANIIATVDAVKALIDTASRDWPDTVRIEYTLDESEQVEIMLGDLENNVIAAVVLVMIVILFALGVRTSILVGLSIPGAFLAGVAVLWMLGFTMNIVVLFSLILVVGMLVDGAIVTTELADRRLLSGDTPKQAYSFAARRMAWPIIASTATTLSVFFPLLFWEGVVGEFMKFLPITVIITLGASLLMALVFIPVLGGLIGKAQPQSARQRAQLRAAETGDPRDMRGLAGAYVRALQWAILKPGRTLLFAVLALVFAFKAYGTLGNGVSFFPSVEPDFAQVTVRSRDNFSIYERDALVRRVEDKLLTFDEIQSVYARSTLGGGQTGEDVIGTIQIEFTDWDTRRTAAEIGEEIRTVMADVAGVDVQYAVQEGGPGAGKPIALDVLSRNGTDQQQAVTMIRAAMDRIGGFTDVTDDRPLPGVEWQLDVNRAEAARFGADITLLGQAVQLLTNGIQVADYRPSDAEGEVDIRVRFPANERTLEELESLRIPTNAGLIPVRNFVEFVPAPRTGTIHRVDQRRVITIEADVAPGVNVAEQVVALQRAIDGLDLPSSVETAFGGEAEEQADAMQFLLTAFVAALGAMFLILVTQFNSTYQALVVMSAIVFSIAGVLIGVMITGRPFGIVMGGIGVIALAGIVVNNNIVLIDTFNDLRRSGQSAREALLRTGAQRLRPVVLTSMTTALGLLPMVIGVNIDFIDRTIVFGAPSTQWWTELSTAIAGGLVFATILTLIVTPAMLMLGVRLGEWRARRRAMRQGGAVAAE